MKDCLLFLADLFCSSFHGLNLSRLPSHLPPLTSSTSLVCYERKPPSPLHSHEPAPPTSRSISYVQLVRFLRRMGPCHERLRHAVFRAHVHHDAAARHILHCSFIPSAANVRQPSNSNCRFKLISSCTHFPCSLLFPAPHVRSMNRLTAVRVWLALFLAAYNVIMFGIDLAYDSGATYQWATYPLACFAWAFCVAIMMLEIKYGMSISWVLRAFFVASFVAACLLLGADIAARAASSTHILHFLLLALMAGVGSIRPDSDSGEVIIVAVTTTSATL